MNDDDRATLPSTFTPEGATTTSQSASADKLILDREEKAIDWRDPWRPRKFGVTLLSTFRNLFVLGSNKRPLTSENGSNNIRTGNAEPSLLLPDLEP